MHRFFALLCLLFWSVEVQAQTQTTYCYVHTYTTCAKEMASRPACSGLPCSAQLEYCDVSKVVGPQAITDQIPQDELRPKPGFKTVVRKPWVRCGTINGCKCQLVGIKDGQNILRCNILSDRPRDPNDPNWDVYTSDLVGVCPDNSAGPD